MRDRELQSRITYYVSPINTSNIYVILINMNIFLSVNKQMFVSVEFFLHFFSFCAMIVPFLSLVFLSE